MMWLQFLFPIYIWLIVGLITILCKVSTTTANITGSTNPIAVLAMLFLLSYAKLLRTTIAAFSFTILEYPDDKAKFVWLYGGNIGYLDLDDGLAHCPILGQPSGNSLLIPAVHNLSSPWPVHSS